MSQTKKEEILQISIGSNANSVTAHLLNLQGLACTSSSSSSSSSYNSEYKKEPLCSPNKTHEISENNNTWVPRVLFVDGRDSFDVRNNNNNNKREAMMMMQRELEQQQQLQQEIFSGSSVDNNSSDVNNITTGWNFLQSSSSSSSQTQAQSRGEYNWDGKIDIFQKPLPETEDDDVDDPVALFQNAASILSSHTASRYNAPPSSSKYTSVISSSSSATLGKNDRHMVWDSDEDEEDEEDEDEEIKKHREYQARMRQKEEIQNASTNLQTAWTNLQSSEHNKKSLDELLHWSNYWMYPHPSFSSYAIPLPFSTTSAINPNNTDVEAHLASFSSGYSPASSSSSSLYSSTWRNEVASESLRHSLEKSDSLRGVNLYVDNGTNSNIGFYTGFGTGLCQELKEECKSAAIFVHWIHSSSPSSSEMKKGEESTTKEESLLESNAKKIKAYRSGIAQGLSLSHLSECADVVLPLSLSSCSKFQSSGKLAAALECSSLSYRLNSSSSSSSCIGLQSGYLSGGSGGPYETCSSLSFHEFISCLKPSSRHGILELDGLYQPLSSSSSSSLTGADAAALAPFLQSPKEEEENSLHSKLIQGTSTERLLKQKQEEEMRRNAAAGNSPNWNSKARRRMQMMGRTPDVDPGLWMEDKRYGGLLSSFSPTIDGNRETKATVQRRGRRGVIVKPKKEEEMSRARSLHHHFALSASFRPPSPPKSNTLSFASFRKKEAAKKKDDRGDTAVSTYLTPMMESLGIRYRPEISSSVVVPQSIFNLTECGRVTAAGMYWPSVFSDSQQQQQSSSSAAASCIEQTPILSLLGNTTRSYPYIQNIVKNYQFSLTSQVNSGFYARDVCNGIVPEYDDCEESMEGCRNLMDCYEPPLGSGLGEEEGCVSSDEEDYFDINED